MRTTSGVTSIGASQRATSIAAADKLAMHAGCVVSTSIECDRNCSSRDDFLNELGDVGITNSVLGRHAGEKSKGVQANWPECIHGAVRRTSPVLLSSHIIGQAKIWCCLVQLRTKVEDLSSKRQVKNSRLLLWTIPVTSALMCDHIMVLVDVCACATIRRVAAVILQYSLSLGAMLTSKL